MYSNCCSRCCYNSSCHISCPKKDNFGCLNFFPFFCLALRISKFVKAYFVKSRTSGCEKGESCKQGQSEMVSKSRNKIIKTWGPNFGDPCENIFFEEGISGRKRLNGWAWGQACAAMRKVAAHFPPGPFFISNP